MGGRQGSFGADRVLPCSWLSIVAAAVHAGGSAMHSKVLMAAGERDQPQDGPSWRTFGRGNRIFCLLLVPYLR